MHLFRDYFFLVYLSAMGVIQIMAVFAKLEGLWFFGKARTQYIFGALAILAAFAWFFSVDRNNQQATAVHRVEGSQQLGLFLLAAVASYVTTLVIASLIQARVGSDGRTARQGKQDEEGVETLKTMTFFQGIATSLSEEQRKDSD